MFGLSKRAVAVGAAAILAINSLGTVALAADLPPTPAPTATATATQETNYRDIFLGKTARILGVDPASLQSAMKWAAIETVDEAVANGDLDKSGADAAKQRIEQYGGAGLLGLPGVDVPDGSAPPDSVTPGSITPGDTTPATSTPTIRVDAIDTQAAMQATIKAVADKLRMSTIELMIRLRSGQTLADIARERGVSEQEILTTVAEAVKPQIDLSVKEGKLTQAEADQIYQKILQAHEVLSTPVGSIPVDQLLARMTQQ